MTAVNEPTAGTVIAERYYIEKELGRGGFGIVFKARHLDIEHTIALKVLLATHADKDTTAIERFRREAVMAASLHYPNTVRVFDYGHTDDGVFYIVMEFLDGYSLDKEMDKPGRIAPARSVHIIEQVLMSLTEAHAHTIVHRDIKPENIMIQPLSYDRDFVKVMDFGIAKMVDADMPSLTQAGKVFGTPKFMAPEQLRGEELTPATDVYATGHILHEMLTGEAVVKGSGLAAVVEEIVFGPSARVPRNIGVPEGLCAVVDRACNKDLTERYPTATQFLDDLRAWKSSTAEGGLEARLEAIEKQAKHSPQTMRLEVGELSPMKELHQPAPEVAPSPVERQVVAVAPPDKKTIYLLFFVIALQLLTLGAVLGVVLLSMG